MSQQKTAIDIAVSQIAEKHLRIKTLKKRNSDHLDFYDLSVWEIKNALEKAFVMGVEIGAMAARAKI